MSDLNAVMATRRGWPTSGAARATVEGGGELGRQGQTKLGSLFWAVIAAVLAMTSLAWGIAAVDLQPFHGCQRRARGRRPRHVVLRGRSPQGAQGAGT